MANKELTPVNIAFGTVRLNVQRGKHQPHAVMRMPATVAMRALVRGHETQVEHHRSGLLVVRHPDSAQSQGTPLEQKLRTWRHPEITELRLPASLARQDLTHYSMGNNLVAVLHGEALDQRAILVRPGLLEQQLPAARDLSKEELMMLGSTLTAEMVYRAFPEAAPLRSVD